nr:prolyl 4-hydroxylase alpha subunit homologues protein [Sicyoidochytrium minutum DNA virus]
MGQERLVYEKPEKNEAKFTDLFDNFVVRNFATDQECQSLIHQSETNNNKKNATVGHKGAVDPSVRNNTTSYLGQKGIAGELSKRVMDLLQAKRPQEMQYISSMEGIQVQIYGQNEHYTDHLDAWTESNYKNAKKRKKGFFGMVLKNRRPDVPKQRPWTCVLYLNNVPEGGTTSFPKTGAKVSPEKGKLVCWKNVREDLTANPDTLHRGDHVTAGRKWLANFWFNTDVIPPLESPMPRERNGDLEGGIRLAYTDNTGTPAWVWVTAILGTVIFILMIVFVVKAVRRNKANSKGRKS